MIKLIKQAFFLTVSLLFTPMLVAEPLSPNELHATMGIVTNFILDDDIQFHGKSYKPVTSPHTGRVWLDRNLGASQVCTSFNDTACYGDYYQWGRNFDGHQDSTSEVSAILASNVNDVGDTFFITSTIVPNDWASIDSTGATRAANWSKTDGSSICPVGFRVPHFTELKAETLDEDVVNKYTAFTNFLKLPSAGYRNDISASLNVQGLWGLVWTSSANGSYSHSVTFDNSNVFTDNLNRAFGISVRCLRD